MNSNKQLASELYRLTQAIRRNERRASDIKGVLLKRLTTGDHQYGNLVARKSYVRPAFVPAYSRKGYHWVDVFKV